MIDEIAQFYQACHSTTPKPRQTRNSLKSEAELRKAKNLLSNAKKSRGKFDIDNFVLKK